MPVPFEELLRIEPTLCHTKKARFRGARQESDLRAFPKKAGYKVAGVWKETASGAKDERAECKLVLALAQTRKIDVILVTELTRWGRSMLDCSTRCRSYKPGTCRWWLRPACNSNSVSTRREN
jgi:hypothetical protein